MTAAPDLAAVLRAGVRRPETPLEAIRAEEARARHWFADRLELQLEEVPIRRSWPLPDLRGQTVRTKDGEQGRIVDYATGRFPMVAFADRAERISRTLLTLTEET